MYYNCEAVVLRKYRFSETSYILHLFTREFGRVNALAKGARRTNSVMYGHFDLFNLEEVTIFKKKRSDLDLATGAYLLREYREVRSSALLYMSVGVLAEIILKSCMLYDKHELAFDAFARLLSHEDDLNNKVVSNLVNSIWLILRDLGFEPYLEHCMLCEREHITSFTLDPKYGGVVCDACRKVDFRTCLTAGELASMRFIAKNNSDLKIGLSAKSKLLGALYNYCCYVLGAECLSFRMLQQFLASSLY